MATIIINNLSGSSVTYQGNTIISGGSYTVSSYLLPFIKDASFLSDLSIGSINLSVDGNILWGAAAVDVAIKLSQVSFIGIPTAAVPTATSIVGGKDLSGNLQSFTVNNKKELLVSDSINVSGQYRAQSVTTSAAEALGGSTILTNRKFISITPTNGTIYWGFDNSVTTSNGTPIFKNQTVTIAATDNVHIYVIASTTTDVRIAEGS